MREPFEDALLRLIAEYEDSTSRDEMISAMELRIMALKEEGEGE